MSAIVLSKLTTIDKKNTKSPRVRRSRIQSNKATTSTPQNNGILYTIGTPLEEVNDSLKKLIKNNREEDKRKKEEAKKKKNEDREKKLEKPKGLGIKLPSIKNPFNKINFNFFDKIGNFLLFTFLGWLFNNFSLGSASPLVRQITSVLTVGFFELINNTFMFLLDTFVFFVDQGYKLHDTISGLIKRVKGEDGEDGAPESRNIFNKFTDQLSYAGTLFATSGSIMLAVMAGTKVLANSILDERDNPDKPDKPDKPDPNKPDSKKPPKPSSKSPRAPKGKLSRAKQIARLSTKQIGRKAILKAVRPALRRMTIIGGLLDFGISVALGEPLGRAAFSVIGAGLLGTIGAGLGGPVGAILGGLAGDYIGAKLYDVFFTGKKNVGPKETQKARSGGVVGRTNKRKRIVKSQAPKRTIQAKPKAIQRPIIYNQKTSPGKNVGGPKAITKLFVDPENSWSFSDTIDRIKGRNKPNPYGALTKIAGIMRDIPFGIGSLMSSTVDMVLGQLPAKQVYENISNSIMYIVSAFNAENTQQLLSRISTFASGGEIPAERSISVNSGMMDKSKLSTILEKSISRKMRESLNVIRGEISKKDYEKEGERSGESGDGPGGSESGGGSSGSSFETKEWRALLDTIAMAEGNTKWSTWAGYQKHGPDDLTGLTIKAVHDLQTTFLQQGKGRKTGSAVVGRYQFKDLIFHANRAGLDPNKSLFSPENQDKMAIAAVKSRGVTLEMLRSEGLSTRVADLLAPEWASFPYSPKGGRSYHGQGFKPISKLQKEYSSSLSSHTNATVGGVGGAVGTGLKTGPSAYIGGSTEFHIDTKIKSDLSWKEKVNLVDQLARGYAQRGRKIEFSNPAVSGEVYNPDAPFSAKVKLLKAAFGAHSHSYRKGWVSMDYYIPLKSHGRGHKSVEGAEILSPSIPGGSLEYHSGGGYGAFTVLVDPSGNVISKTGHGDIRGAKSGKIKFDNKPITQSDIIASTKVGNVVFTKRRTPKGIIFTKNGKEITQIEYESSVPQTPSRPPTLSGNKSAPKTGGYGGGNLNIQSSLQPQINSNNISRFASYNNPSQTAHLMIQPVIINKPAQQIAKTMGYPFTASGASSVPSMNLDLGRA